MAVASLLMALAAPSILSLSPSRKVAVHELAGFLETARARAVSGQREIYVAFAGEDFPVESNRFRVYGIFDADDENRENRENEEATRADRALRMVSPWRRLREGLVFGSAAHFETVPDLRFRTLHDAGTRRPFPVPTGRGTQSEVEMPYLVFNRDGSVAVPGFADADSLYLAVVEGLVDRGARKVTLTRTRPGIGGGAYALGEIVGISHYTGKSTVLTD